MKNVIDRGVLTTRGKEMDDQVIGNLEMGPQTCFKTQTLVEFWLNALILCKIMLFQVLFLPPHP